MILKHLLYLYFVTRKASHDTFLVMLLDTALNDLLLYILSYSLIFACFIYYSSVFVCLHPYMLINTYIYKYIYEHII